MFKPKTLLYIFLLCIACTGYALASYVPLTVSNGSQSASNVNYILVNGDISFTDLGNGEVMLDVNSSPNGTVLSTNTITDNALVRGDGGAYGIQDSGITVDDSDNISNINNLTVLNNSFLNFAQITNLNAETSSFNGFTFFNSNSSAQFNGTVSIPSGAATGLVLTSDTNGLATWQAIPSSADNLGSHIAGQNLNLNGFSLINAQDVNGVTANFTNLNITTNIQYANGAAAGLFLMSDANGNASWQTIAGINNGAINNATILASTLQDPTINGFAFFTANSTAQFNGTVSIPSGAATGLVLTSDANGLATWQAIPSSADNLGSHIAGQNLNLNGFSLINAQDVNGVTANFTNLNITTNIQYANGAAAGLFLMSDANGNASWQTIAGINNGAINNATILASTLQDPSINGFAFFTANSTAQFNGTVSIPSGAATGLVLTSDANGLATWQTIPSSADNLGSHIAGQNLNLNGFSLINAQDVNGVTANFTNGNFTNLSVTTNIQYANGAAAGLFLMSDANGNASWQTIAGINNGTINNATILASTLQDPTINGFAFFTANSTAQFNGTVSIPSGAATGLVLTSDANGLATWQAIPSSADNLGSHIAGQNLNLNGFSLINAQDVNGVTANFTNGNFTNLNVTTNIQYANGAAAGLFLMSDINGNASWQTIAGINNGAINNATILASTLQDPTINGFAFFTANSTAQFNGTVSIPSGAATGLVLTSDANGLATWQTIPSSADNLGSHIAGQNLNLNGFSLINAQDVNGVTANFTNGNFTNLSVTTNIQYANGANAGFVLSSDANGNASWRDLSTLSTNGDNLGNHTATANLNLNGFSLINAQDVNGVTANFTNGNFTNLSVTTNIQYANGAAAGLFLMSDVNGNASWQTIAGINNGAINNATILASTLQDPTINGFAFFTANSTAQFNGTVSIPSGAATGLVLTSDANGLATWQAIPSSADNLGSHIAGQNLNLNGFSLINAQDVNGVTANFTNGNFTNLSVTTNIQYANGANAGFVLSSDANGNASWRDLSTLSTNGDNLGNHTATANLNLNGFSLINAQSVNGVTANFTNGNFTNLNITTNIQYTNGAAAGLFLMSDINGNASWQTIAGINNGAINNATILASTLQDPTINGFAFFTANSTAQFNGTVSIPSGAATGLVLTSDANGLATWQAIPSSADNLGSHIAGQNLNLNGFSLINAQDINGVTANFSNGNFNVINITNNLNYSNGAAAGFVLTSDINGNASWQAAASALASGADGAIQFSENGVLSSNGSAFHWDINNGRLGIGTNTPSYSIHTTGDIYSGNAVRANNFVYAGTSTVSPNIGTGLYANNALVYNTLRINQVLSNINYFEISQNAGRGILNGRRDGLDLQSNGTTSIRVLNNRFVGLSDSIPSALLDVGNGTANFIDGIGDALIADDLEIDGNLYVNGSYSTSFTTGSVVFAGANGTLSENNSTFFWDINNGRLGIGTNTPSEDIEIFRAGSARIVIDDGSFPLQAGSDGSVGAHFGLRGGKGLSFAAAGDFIPINISAAGATSFPDINSALGRSNIRFGGLYTTDANVYARNNTSQALIVHGAAGQTTNLTEWQNSATTVLSAMDANGRLGLGISTPSATLDINGSFQYLDGNQTNGFILTSDANGNATWQANLGADNLGNHTAEQNLDMNGFSLVNALEINGSIANFQDINAANGNFTNIVNSPLFNGGVFNGGAANITTINATNGTFTGILNSSLFNGSSATITNITGTNGNFTTINASIFNGGIFTGTFQDPTINGFAFFTANSTAQFNGQIIIPTGAANGLVLMSDANGIASWGTLPSSGSAAAGSNGSIQFNFNGGLAADAANFHWDDSNDYMGLGTDTPNSTLELNGALSFTQEFNNGNSGAAITVDFVNGNKQRVTLDANTTITIDAPGVGNYLLKVVQDATGSRTVTWSNGGGGAIRWPSGVAPTLSTTANAIDIISCYYDGTDYFCLGNLNFI